MKGALVTFIAKIEGVVKEKFSGAPPQTSTSFAPPIKILGGATALTLFRRPDKYHIGEDFDSFVEKLRLSFEAVDLTCPKKRRLALLSKLREEEFRIAESIDFPENNDAWQE